MLKDRQTNVTPGTDATVWQLIAQGDTNSTLAGALAASKLHIDVIHVEAGLRSYNRLMPEEVNRVLTDHLSKYLFCPSSSSIHNLEKEGITKTKSRHVSDVGDIMKDSLRLFSEKVGHLNEKKDTILCTIHRQENVGNKNALENIVNNLNELSKKYKIIFPLHPSTKKWIKKFDLKLKFDISEPLGFLEMIKALKECSIVITDSGGLQKEAFFAGVPCITLREKTEWNETVKSGWNFLSNPIDYNSDNEKYYQNKNIEFEENFFDFNLIKSKKNNLNSKKTIRNLFKI